jgi:hypothetical protein
MKMRNQQKSMAAWLFLSASILAHATASAQTTAFTYQGQLNDSGASANGSYDISFAAYDAAANGNLIGGIVTNPAVAVSNGVFVTAVDFGNGVFTGADLWLEIGVSAHGANAFTTIQPRQMITPVPTAFYARISGTANTVASSTVSASQLNTAAAPASGQVLSYNGTQLVWQDPVTGGASGGWSLSGNLGTSPGINFLGTADSQPLELKAGGVRGFRLEPDATGSGAPNVIGGSPANYVSGGVVGATIAGGGAVNYSGSTFSNSVTASFATIGGGVRNSAGGMQALVGGGYQNTAGGYISSVLGGAYNGAYGSEATVGGGAYNVATNSQAFVGGGYQNTASGYISTVAGGAYNVGNNTETFVGGGAYNVASGIGAAVVGGGTDGGSSAGNGAAGAASFIGGGLGNSTTASGYVATIAGGSQNIASGETAFVGGGLGNTASGDDRVEDVEILLGSPHFFFFSGSSTVSGGHGNTASASCATVPGGAFNLAGGDFSFAAGFHANALNDGSFVWADDSSSASFSSAAANQFLIRAVGGVGIGTAQTPPGGLRVASGGLAVTGASSPHYPGAAGVFIEKASSTSTAVVYAYDYNASAPLPLALNSPGGNVGIGMLNPQETLDVNGTTRTHTLIISGGSDLAEPFKMGGAEIPKGSVVVIDKEHPGELKISSREYDTKVAGIVSGANGINPGIALHQEGALEGGQNVALSGRVYAMADASFGPIEPGDLLTTSTTPGHAMKITDRARGQGAILGKAMTGLDAGRGMVLVLVTLQ